MRRYGYLVLGLASIIFVGCIGSDSNEEPMDPYFMDTDTTEYVAPKDRPILYDTEIDPNASFDFVLDGLPYVGMNLSGPEWDGSNKWPDRHYTAGYVSFPKYFKPWGLTTVRLPFSWERLQPTLSGPLDEQYFEELKVTVFTLRRDGAKGIIIDAHNYARYNSELIGVGPTYDDLADLWRRLAEVFKPYPEVIFGLMNEPTKMSTQVWVDAANTAISAIRATGAKNLIFLNGNGWSGAHSWYSDWYDEEFHVSNAEAMLNIVDPLGSDYTIFEVHQYLNKDSSDWGTCQCSDWETQGGCLATTVGSYRMNGFTNWLRTNGKKGFLGEFGTQSDPTCLAALDDQIRHVEDNADVYVGWTFWSAGPGCASWQAPMDPYCFDEGQVSSPQLDTLVGHINANPALYYNR